MKLISKSNHKFTLKVYAKLYFDHLSALVLLGFLYQFRFVTETGSFSFRHNLLKRQYERC